MGKRGRPKLEEGKVRSQLSIFLDKTEREQVNKMAHEVGNTVSQVIAFLIRQAFADHSYLNMLKDMSPEDLEDLDEQRARVLFKTRQRSENAQNRNLSRRMGLDRGLTNVMVIDAPENLNLPGIFCQHFGKVWIIPYCMFHLLDVNKISLYKCYESVVDFFAGRAVSDLYLANFIEEHKDYNLTSEGEKSVLRRLAQVYDSLDGLPEDMCEPDFPQKDPAELPYLKDLTVKGEYPYLSYSDRQKVLQDALTGAIRAISEVENEIRFEEAAFAAQTVVPRRDTVGNFVKRGRGRPPKTPEAKAATQRRRYLRIRAEKMLDKVYNLALYNHEPVNLPPEITHQNPPADELSAAFIETVNDLREFLAGMFKKAAHGQPLTPITEVTVAPHVAAQHDINAAVSTISSTNATTNSSTTPVTTIDGVRSFDLDSAKITSVDHTDTVIQANTVAHVDTAANTATVSTVANAAKAAKTAQDNQGQPKSDNPVLGGLGQATAETERPEIMSLNKAATSLAVEELSQWYEATTPKLPPHPTLAEDKDRICATNAQEFQALLKQQLSKLEQWSPQSGTQAVDDSTSSTSKSADQVLEKTSGSSQK